MSKSRDETAPEPKTGSCLARCMGIFGIVLAVTLLVAIAAFGTLVWRARAGHFSATKNIDAELARIHAKGEPITVAELYAFHRLPARATDSTTIWIAALDSFDQGKLDTDLQTLPLVGEGRTAQLPLDLNEDQLSEVRVFLEKYDATTAAILAAAATPGECCFPIKFEDGISASPPITLKLHSALRLLAVKLRMLEIQGNLEEAIDILEAMLAASDALKNQPSTAEQATQGAMLFRTVTEISGLLNEYVLTETKLARLQAKLASVQLETGLTTGLVGERGVHFQMYLSTTPPGVVSLTEGDTTGRQPGLAHDCQMYLEYMAKLIDASRLPFPEARNRAGAIEGELKAATSKWGEWERKQHVFAPQDISLHVLGFSARARAIAHRDAMTAALAAERFRIATGAYPKGWDDLVPAYLPTIPSDPFDGQPIRMIASNEEVLIYSIADDLQDDGGRIDNQARSLDIVARVRAEKAAQSE